MKEFLRLLHDPYFLSIQLHGATLCFLKMISKRFNCYVPAMLKFWRYLQKVTLTMKSTVCIPNYHWKCLYFTQCRLCPFLQGLKSCLNFSSFSVVALHEKDLNKGYHILFLKIYVTNIECCKKHDKILRTFNVTQNLPIQFLTLRRSHYCSN